MACHFSRRIATPSWQGVRLPGSKAATLSAASSGVVIPLRYATGDPSNGYEPYSYTHAWFAYLPVTSGEQIEEDVDGE